jgi:uncharacterized flavoprotein (TIGR03862 family)
MTGTSMKHIAIVGGGPAGLMAAEVLAAAGRPVTLYDRMPSVGRKFLMAGRGGLNLTHGEALEPFMTRYGEAQDWLRPMITAFSPEALQGWSHGLGQDTFIGSSGRIFPRSFKTSPLLRAWLRRLDGLGVTFALGHHWTGWNASGALTFESQDGCMEILPAATILALGGASWPRLGADGGWVKLLEAKGIPVAPLQPANCGFRIVWSQHLIERFAGTPLKRIAVGLKGYRVRGEAMLTAEGIEGGAIYALSATIREAIRADGEADLRLDLRPDLSGEQILARLSRQRGSESFANHLRKALAMPPNAIGLLREVNPDVSQLSAKALTELIKDLPLRITGVRPIERAISTAGGVQRMAVDDGLMLRANPGVFCAGEMLDWEAPTGGYLLQACFATGRAAGLSALHYVEAR